ncbi:MAG: tRNA (N(6)-L-threonylcarbamoyladenosine(37)-C(2))-methylthiotransferase MtaB, partial [Martelella sp.]
SRIGSTATGLTERGENGHTENFAPVATPGLEPGQFVAARITGHDGKRLIADFRPA